MCGTGNNLEIFEEILYHSEITEKKETKGMETKERKPKHSSKTTVQKCNPFLITVLYGGVRAYCFLRGIRIKETNKLHGQPEGPAIVLCNHGSFIDFIYAGSMLLKCRPHFVVARLYFYHKWLALLLKKLGAFPKSMFAMDIESTKNSMKVLHSGEVLVMMPEARLSTAGRFEDIQKNTYSFLKKMAVPVYTIKLQGDYLADPKWGSGIRRGARIEAELDTLFTAQQLNELSVEQICQAVEERLYYDEFQWLASHPDVHYHCKTLAEGLENILTTCPVCGQKYTLSTKKNDIFCKNCGHITSLDDRYQFTGDFQFQNLSQWYDWQVQQLEEEIRKDPDYVLESEVEFRLPGEGDSLTRHAGTGICRLDRTGLQYTGTKDGEECQLQFPMESIYRLLFGAGEDFEIYRFQEIYYFRPKVLQSSVEWYMASRILSDEAANDR